MIQLLKRSGVQTAVLAMSVALLAACGEANKRTASYYLNAVTESAWTQAEANKIVVHLSNGGGSSFNARMWVDGLAQGTPITLNALQPYVIEVVQDGKPYTEGTSGRNNRRHSFTESVGNFYQGVALQKVVTNTAEYKMSFIRDLVMLKPDEQSLSTSTCTNALPCESQSVKLYVVPVTAGTFSMRCTPHSAAGATSATSTMAYPITVVGAPNLTVDHEVSQDFSVSSLAAWVPSTAQTDTPTGWHSSQVISNKFDFVARSNGFGSGTGSLSRDTKSVVRFSKESGYTGEVEIVSDLFNNSSITWVGDKNARIVPYGLKSIKMLVGSSSTSQSATSTLLKYDGYVDLYVEPKVSGSATIEVNSVNNSVAIN